TYPLDERAQVEGDLAFLGGLNGPRVLALEDMNEARVRAPILFFPQGLSLWCLEYSVGGLHRDVLERAGDDRCKPGAVRGKRLLDTCGGIRAREEGVHEVDRELLANLVV